MHQEIIMKGSFKMINKMVMAQFIDFRKMKNTPENGRMVFLMDLEFIYDLIQKEINNYEIDM